MIMLEYFSEYPEHHPESVVHTLHWDLLGYAALVKVHKYVVHFSDAFDLQYGVAVLRMRKRLDVSQPSELHSKKCLHFEQSVSLSTFLLLFLLPYFSESRL